MKVSKKSQLVTLRLTKGNFKKEQKISLTEWNVGTIKFLKNWSFNNFSLLVRIELIILTKVLNSPALWVESYFKTAPQHLIKQQVIQSTLDQVAIWFRQHLIQSSFDPVIKKSIFSRVFIFKIISFKTWNTCSCWRKNRKISFF